MAFIFTQNSQWAHSCMLYSQMGEEWKNGILFHSSGPSVKLDTNRNGYLY